MALPVAFAAGVVLVVAIALTGCSAGSDQRAEIPGPRTSEEIVECLEAAAQKTNFTVSESEADLDEIARKTTDRAVAAELEGSRTMIVVEATESAADRTRQAYREGNFLKKRGTLEQYGAIVVAYQDTPDPKQRDALFECVGSGSKP